MSVQKGEGKQSCGVPGGQIADQGEKDKEVEAKSQTSRPHLHDPLDTSRAALHQGLEWIPKSIKFEPHPDHLL